MNPLGNRTLPISAVWTSLKLLCLIACVVSLAHPVQAQTNTTQVTLSCNDGHSVNFDCQSDQAHEPAGGRPGDQR